MKRGANFIMAIESGTPPIQLSRSIILAAQVSKPGDTIVMIKMKLDDILLTCTFTIYVLRHACNRTLLKIIYIQWELALTLCMRITAIENKDPMQNFGSACQTRQCGGSIIIKWDFCIYSIIHTTQQKDKFGMPKTHRITPEEPQSCCVYIHFDYYTVQAVTPRTDCRYKIDNS